MRPLYPELAHWIRTWLNEAVESVAADGVTFSVPVTSHTFRHSYARYMLYNGIPLRCCRPHGT